MAEIIKNRVHGVKKFPVIVFVDFNTDEEHYKFNADEEFNPVFDKESEDAQKESYEKLLKDDRYYKYKKYEQRFTVENAIAKCECGKEIELYDQYINASECPYCGRWHDLFGQLLKNPEYWEEEVEEEEGEYC